jgi:hypothetical protein
MVPAAPAPTGGANIRTGNQLSQMASLPPSKKDTTGPVNLGGAAPKGGAAPVPGGGRNWQPPRKVDATPLDQTIRTSPSTSMSPRRVQIAEEKRFPWAAAALGALIVLAAGVVLVTMGVINL